MDSKLTLDDLFDFSSSDLREWRERLNLTQEAAALLLGASDRSLRSYESGKAVPFRLALACISYDAWPQLRRKIPELLNDRDLAYRQNAS